jgi:hypothetical protein
VAKPKPTPRPTPTAVPTPVPTPVRTMPAEPTDPIRLGPPPGDRPTDAVDIAAAGGLPGNAATADSVVSLRVVDPATPPGLVESIVGNVTGFFFGG